MLEGVLRVDHPDLFLVLGVLPHYGVRLVYDKFLAAEHNAIDFDRIIGLDE